MYLEHPFAVADNNNNAVAPEPYEAQMGITTQIPSDDVLGAFTGLQMAIDESPDSACVSGRVEFVNEAVPIAKEERANTPFIRGIGTFFDEHIDMSEPEGSAFTARILEIYDTVRPKQRKRGREAKAIRIRKILANAVRAYFYRKNSAILYFRKADASWYANSPSWMKHGALGDVVDAFFDAGFVEKIKGKKMGSNSKTPSWTSSYRPTRALIDLALECGVSAESVGRRVSPDQLVRLLAPKAGQEYDYIKGGLVQPSRGKSIKFELTDESQEWTATLEAINSFYRQQDIDLGLSPEELSLWLDDMNADPERTGTPYCKPELFKTDIYRVFNNGNADNPCFDDGGRLFGGWWMSASEELRKAITINGQPTVELDYSECHPRMLYHLRGHDCEGELYVLPEIAAYVEANDLHPRTYRPYIKWLTQVMINCKGRPWDVKKPDKIIMPPDFTVKQIIGFIEARHHPILEDFKTGLGLKLMRLESDIALEIVSTAMEEGWTVLSVHDSFVTTTDKEDKLKAMMIDSYVKRLEKLPEFKPK